MERDRQTDRHVESIENSKAGRAGSATKVCCRLRQEDHKSEANLVYVLSSSIEVHKAPCFKVPWTPMKLILKGGGSWGWRSLTEYLTRYNKINN